MNPFQRYLLDEFPGILFVRERGGTKVVKGRSIIVAPHWHVELPGRSFR